MQELFNWSTVELERIEKEYPYIPGVLDGRGVVEQKLHFKEYNKRLAALKEKYENEPAEPVTKARIFNQTLKPTGT